MTIPPFCMPGPRRPQPPPRLPEPLQWPIPLLLEKFTEYRSQLVQDVIAHLPDIAPDAYVKPEGGIPEADLDALVRAALALARTSVQDVSGKADLVNGKVPAEQLPSFVDDVLEYANLANFPATGEEGKLYVAKDTNTTYRWTGSRYTEVSPSPTPVAPSTSASAEGKAADAYATGTALAARPTKAQMDAGWWSEWTVMRDGVDVTSQVAQPVWDGAGWNVSESIVSGDVAPSSPSGNETTLTLSWSAEYAGPDDMETAHYTATRHRVSAPVPTKPSDIGAQPAGSYATAAQGVKADAALSRAEAEAGFTAWTILRDGADVTEQVQQPYWSDDPDAAHVNQWVILDAYIQGDFGESTLPSVPRGAVALSWYGVSNNVRHPYTATRTRLPTMADIPTGSTSMPEMDADGGPGTSARFAREDHVHPKDTSKQDVIDDLEMIRLNASTGAGAYHKPSGGIPASDMAPAVQTSLGKADAAVQKSDAFGGFVEFFTDSILSASRRFVYRPTDTPGVWVLYWIVDGVWAEVTGGTPAPVKYLVWDATGNGTWKAGSSPAQALESEITGGAAQYGSATVTLAANGVTVAVLSRAVSPVALASDVKMAVDAVPVRYDLPANVTAITTASSEVVEGETVTYGEAALSDRTANRVVVTVAIDELRLVFPSAVSGKVRDFGLRVEVGDGTAALAAPSVSTAAAVDGMGNSVVFENPDGVVLPLADGTASAPGVTVLYFTETAPGRFLVKGDQLQEVL